MFACCMLFHRTSTHFAEKVIPEMFSTIEAQLMKDIYPDEDCFPISLKDIQDIRIYPLNQMMMIRERKLSHVLHSLVILNLIPYSLLVFLQSLQAVQRKRDSVCIYDSYKKAIKKLSKSPGLTPTVNFRDRTSAMITEYIH